MPQLAGNFWSGSSGPANGAGRLDAQLTADPTALPPLPEVWALLPDRSIGIPIVVSEHVLLQEADMISILGWNPGGIFVTMLLGIAGALIGGFLGRVVGWYGPGEAAGLLMSLLGAVVILFVYRRFRKVPG